MGRYSDLLYAQPSFLEGVGRLVDFAGLLDDYNDAPSPDDADRAALTSDWYAVGDDFRTAAERFAHQNHIEVRRANSSPG